MTRDEAIVLARLVRSLRPQQTWDDATPQAWALMLADVRVADAEAAIKNLMTAAKYVDAPAITTEVKRLRDARLERAGVEIPPYPDPDDVAGAIAWQREWQRRIADGETAHTGGAVRVITRPMPHLDNIFRRPTATGLHLSTSCADGDHRCHEGDCQCTCHGSRS